MESLPEPPVDTDDASGHPTEEFCRDCPKAKDRTCTEVCSRLERYLRETCHVPLARDSYCVVWDRGPDDDEEHDLGDNDSRDSAASGSVAGEQRKVGQNAPVREELPARERGQTRDRVAAREPGGVAPVYRGERRTRVAARPVPEPADDVAPVGDANTHIGWC